jgi:hypothetical protein
MTLIRKGRKGFQIIIVVVVVEIFEGSLVERIDCIEYW